MTGGPQLDAQGAFIAPSAEARSAQVSRIIAKARRCRLKLGTAESLTGGGIFSTLISQPGASSVMDAGIVTYCDAAKVRHLAVHDDALEEHSAVSAAVAEQMALHHLRNSQENLVVSATGFAGPCDPSITPIKPSGTLYIGIAFRPEPARGEKIGKPVVRVFSCQMSGSNRGADIAEAVQYALDALEDTLDAYITQTPDTQVHAAVHEGLVVPRRSLIKEPLHPRLGPDGSTRGIAA